MERVVPEEGIVRPLRALASEVHRDGTEASTGRENGASQQGFGGSQRVHEGLAGVGVFVDLPRLR